MRAHKDVLAACLPNRLQPLDGVWLRVSERETLQHPDDLRLLRARGRRAAVVECRRAAIIAATRQNTLSSS